MSDLMDLRELNRATLARQGLLERSGEDVADVVRRVGGLQAQTPSNPMVALWSRCSGFRREQLLAAVEHGVVVRGTTLRGTLHLHHVDEYRELRMTLQPMLDTLVRSVRRRAREQDLEPAIELGRSLIRSAPRTIGEVKAALKEHFPESDPQALGLLVRYELQLLMVPDTSTPNGWPNLARFAPATKLIGGRLPTKQRPELVLRRFLETLGPGSVRDAQVWSGVRGLKDVAARMLDDGELVEVLTFDDRVLLDLPDAPPVDADATAAVRFLPMWDNLLLSHADRSRVVADDHKAYLASKNGMPPPTFLVDGFVHGTWTVERHADAATLRLTAFGRTPKAAQDALVEEGQRLLAFVEPDATNARVRFD
jgi:hypothetical protein